MIVSTIIVNITCSGWAEVTGNRKRRIRYSMRLRSIISAGVIRVALATLAAGALAPGVVRAQDDSGSMGSPNGTQPGGMDSNSAGGSMNSDMPANDPSMAPPMAKMHMRQPISGSMMAAPPYGLAPMKVG